MATFDRFDICAAWFWYAAAINGTNEAASIQARLAVIGYGPGYMAKASTLEANAREIYETLLAKYEGAMAVNPSDHDWTHNVYTLGFGECGGSYGSTYLKVWANSLESALDEAVDYIAENPELKGLLCTELVRETYAEGIKAGLSEEQAMQAAEEGTVVAGNCGDYLPCDSWWMLDEKSTRE